MRCGLYAHPWDLTELERIGGMQRLVDLGYNELSLAMAYHAGRWLTPWHSSGMVRFLEDGCVHFRPSDGYRELTAKVSAEVPDEGACPLLRAIQSMPTSISLQAWTVLFHNSRLGRLHPQSCIVNALGDVYGYALCPARPEVRAYGLQILEDLSVREGLDAIEIEAAGFLGHKHGSHHDKSSYGYEPVADFLLSYCFCSSCLIGLAAVGANVDELRGLVAAGVVKLRREADAMDTGHLGGEDSQARLESLLGESNLQALLAHRLQVYRGFLAEIRIRTEGDTAIHLQLEPSPLFSGSQMGVPIAAVADLVDGIVMTHYGQRPEEIAAIWQSLPEIEVPMRAAIWPRAPQFTSDADLCRVWDAVAAAGGAGLRIYHLGLLPWKTLERVAKVLAQR